MLQRLSLTLSLVLLAACQSVPMQQSVPSEDDTTRAVVETGDLVATLRELNDSVNQLGAMMASKANHAPVSASYAASDDEAPTGDQARAVEALTHALSVLETKRAIHSENIANAGVTAYKRRTLLTSSSLHEESGLRIPEVMGTQLTMTPGALELTGNLLDFAIEGSGFFEIQLPNGDLRYRRNGRFRQDVNGRLVTHTGYLLTDQVAIPEDTQGVSVSEDGQVFALSSENSLTQIGTMRLHTFPNPDGLKRIGRDNYAPTASSGQAQARQPGVQGAGRIKQGYFERSNVNTRDEFVEMQIADRQRAAVRLALTSYGIYAR